MKKIFTLLCGIAFAAQFTTVSAQSTTKMKVYTTDGNVVEYSTSEVDSVTFSAQEDTYAYKIINGHKFINLGLSVLWAETNIGAESAEDYGNYYAWGEVTAYGENKDWGDKEVKTSYNWDTYKYGTYYDLTKYTSSDQILDDADDAAIVNWGDSCRMPTENDFKELRSECTWTWDSDKKGYKVTSNKPGYTNNSIFLAAPGYYANGDLNQTGSQGLYWAKTIYKGRSGNDYCRYGYCLIFNNNGGFWEDRLRYDGVSVRPVAEP